MKKLFAILSYVVLLCSLAPAQVPVTISPAPKLQFLDQNGKPLAGGCVFTYAAGTTTPQATYTDATGTAQNTNPVILDSGGRASIWLTAQGYKFSVASSGGTNCASGTTQYTVDAVTALSFNSAPLIISASPNPATAGFIRMANGDLVNWRNIANSANIGFAQAGVAAAANGNIADVLQYGDSSHGGLQAQAFVDFSPAPAQSGDVRGGNNVCLVAARNAAGTADVCAILLNSSNVLQLGGAAGASLAGPFASPVNAPAIESIKMADQQSGSDCGAKVNAADAALGSAPGKIWVNQACGTAWTTPVALSQNHVLEFVQGGKYASSACPAVTLALGAALVGPPLSSWSNVVPCDGTVGACLQQANGANCASFILASGAETQVRDMIIDGNKANNATGGVGVKANLANRFKLLHAVVQNFPTHGVWMHSTGASNQSCCFKLLDSFVGFNNGDGLYADNTADGSLKDADEIENNGLTAVVNTNASGVATFVSGTQWSTDSSLVNTTVKVGGTLCQVASVTSTTFSTVNCQSSVNSLTNATVYWGGGIELSDSPTARIIGNDIGGNFGFGIIMYGSGTGITAGRSFIIGNQFGNNYTHDVEVEGFGLASSNYASTKHVIEGNEFIGKNALAQPSTWDAIFTRDSQFNIVNGNLGDTDGGDPNVRYLVNITESSAGRDISEVVTSNVASAAASAWTTGSLINGAGFNCNTQNTCQSVAFRANENSLNNGVVTNERSSLNCFIPAGQTLQSCTTILDRPAIVNRLFATLGTVGSGCTTVPVIKITYGANSTSITISNGSASVDSGAIGLNINAASIVISNSTVAAGCTTNPLNIFVAATIEPAK